MICLKCGADNLEDAACCTNCGSQTVTANAVRSARPTRFNHLPVQRHEQAPNWLARASRKMGKIGCWVWPCAPVAFLLGLAVLPRIRGSRRWDDWLDMTRIRTSILPSIAFVLAAAVLFLLLVVRPRHEAIRANCEMGLKVLGCGIMQYEQDGDDQFPSASNWTDAIFPYDYWSSAYHCPGVPKSEPGGYAYNSQLSRLPVRRIQNMGDIPALFDSHGTWNLSGGSELAEPWHDGRLNLCFADVHVRSYSKDELFALHWTPVLESVPAVVQPIIRPFIGPPVRGHRPHRWRSRTAQ